jgi:hypothetical protein
MLMDGAGWVTTVGVLVGGTTVVVGVLVGTDVGVRVGTDVEVDAAALIVRFAEAESALDWPMAITT